MAVKSSGPLSLSELPVEFGGSAPWGLTQFYRGGGRVPNGPAQNANIATSGPISLTQFYGSVKAFVYTKTIAANTQNYNLKSDALANGWDGVVPLQATITVNAGVYIGSASTGSYAFDTGTGFPSGSSLYLLNRGVICGAGGAGGYGGNQYYGAPGGGGQGYSGGQAGWAGGNNGGMPGQSGGSGGPALWAQVPITIESYGTIGGGGGGGGGSGNGMGFVPGTGYYGNSGSVGAPGSAVYNGGAGGGFGQSGTAGTAGYYMGDIGNGFDSGAGNGSGGGPGVAVSGNGNITWLATGFRYGSPF